MLNKVKKTYISPKSIGFALGHGQPPTKFHGNRLSSFLHNPANEQMENITSLAELTVNSLLQSK